MLADAAPNALDRHRAITEGLPVAQLAAGLRVYAQRGADVRVLARTRPGKPEDGRRNIRGIGLHRRGRVADEFAQSRPVHAQSGS